MSKTYASMTKAELINALQDRDERLVTARKIYSEMKLKIEMLGAEIELRNHLRAERQVVKGEPTRFESFVAATQAAKEWAKDRAHIVTQVGATVFKKPRAQA